MAVGGWSSPAPLPTAPRQGPPAPVPNLEVYPLNIAGNEVPHAQPKEPSEHSHGSGSQGAAQGGSGGRKPVSTDQRNKIFVGGVPQEFSQEDLRKLFSQFAPVKRAWVQQHKNKRSSTERSPPQNHRGFGWVVFQENKEKKDKKEQRAFPNELDDEGKLPTYVDKLIGNQTSMFIGLPGGGQVEIKRAKDAQEMKEGSSQDVTERYPAARGRQPLAPTPKGPANRGLVVGGRGPPGVGWPNPVGTMPQRPPPPGLPPPPAPASLVPVDGSHGSHGRPQLPHASAPGAGAPLRDEHGSWLLPGYRPGSPVRVPQPPPRPTTTGPAYCRMPTWSNHLLGKEEWMEPGLVQDADSARSASTAESLHGGGKTLSYI